MTLFRLIWRTIRFYLVSNLTTAGGIAIATAIICGSLIIGDSVRNSLIRIVDMRLGGITHTITAGDRIFSRELSERLDVTHAIRSAAVLKTEAVVSVQNSQARANQVHVWGVDTMFAHITGVATEVLLPGDNEAMISANLAEHLMVDTGDYLLFRMKSIGPIPVNTPFVSESDLTITRRVRIASIIDKDKLGHFSLQASQSAPLNAFVRIDWLNRIMDLGNSANMVMIQSHDDDTDSHIHDLLRAAWLPADGNLLTEKKHRADGTYHWQITSERVFIDNYLGHVIGDVFTEQEQALTYFVNELALHGRSTPYSFVSAVSKQAMATLKGTDAAHLNSGLPLHGLAGQILINQWLADDLLAEPGDSITLHYYEIGPLRELVEREARFMVGGIIPMAVSVNDSILIPNLPGLSDAGSCRDWEAGIPIDLDAIRQKDEDYWDAYRGTPKAIILLEEGQPLWQNRFGNLTSISIPAEIYSVDDIQQTISKQVDPMQLGFMVQAVREQGVMAARKGVNFAELFAGLGVFIILSGLLLTMLLLAFNLKRRQDHLRLFTSLGFSKSSIKKIFLWEALFVSMTGVLAGACLSVVYSKLIFRALNQNWYDIVRTETLEIFIQPSALTTGMLISFLLGMAVVYWGIHKAINENLPSLIRHSEKKRPAVKNNYIKGLSVSLAVVSISLIGLLWLQARFDWLFAWLAAGILFLAACLTGVYGLLHHQNREKTPGFNLVLLGFRNIIRNPLRSFTIVLLLALGSFVIVVTAANRKDAASDSLIRSSGTGGFQFMVETTTPVNRNLNTEQNKLELGLPDNIRFVQFLSTYDDDASCLNLNMVANPRILATDPSQLQGRFHFISRHALLDKVEPWTSLDRDIPGVVPAVADQSVIQWGLGKSVGDTLVYMNERGEEVKLLLIGGLSNSIFQGNVIISANHFLHHFPAAGGTQVLLIEAPGADPQDLQEELGLVFRDHGWHMTETLVKLAEFNTVENTYLQIFFLMGAFGMLLGTIGLAVIMAKSMIERRAETALLRSLGFSISHVLKLYFYEYASLFVVGLVSGTLSALIATGPNFLAANQTVSPGFLTWVLLVLLINGIFWMLFIPLVMIKRIKLLEALRND